MTDYFSELENQLGRVTERGIHNRRRLGRPVGVRVLVAFASVVPVLAVVTVVLQTGGGHRTHRLTSTPPHGASVSQRRDGDYCVNSLTRARTSCSPRRGVSPASRGRPAITPRSGAPVRLVSQLYLHAPSGAKRPTAIARVIEQGGTFGITIAGAGLRANTRRDAYAVWLVNGRREPKLLGFVDPAVKQNGTLTATGRLPTDAFRYHELLITIGVKPIPPKPQPRAAGTVVLEGSFHR